MALRYRASLRTTRMTSVRDDIDSGAGAGTLEICSASYASVLASITLDDPCGSVSGDVLTLAGVPKSGTGIAAGTAAIARFKNSTGTVIVDELTVGTSGAHINLGTLTISIGATVTITGGTLTHNSGT